MSGRPGILHQYTSRLVAFEHTSATSSPSPNLLIFIGGLSDGLLTVPYTIPLALSLPSTWTLAQPILSSSYAGWGTSSLQTDVAELSKLVTYFRSNGKTGKIILMGHSTGCQDVMEYLTGNGKLDRPKIDGGILQAGVSDREALEAMDLDLSYQLSVARMKIAAGAGEEILLTENTAHFYGTTPVTARRFHSLGAVGGDDDYFSTDLDDQQLQKSFGSVPSGTGVCILFSESDEYVGKEVDRVALVERWLGFVRRAGAKVDEHSGVVEGATHNLKGNPDTVIENLIKRVNGFLAGL